MNDRMRDRLMMGRDERNPYGSRGGYVSSDRAYDRGYDERDYRDYNDMARGGSRGGNRGGNRGDRGHVNMRYDGGVGFYEGEFRGMTDNSYGNRGRDSRYDRGYDERDYRDYGDYGYDRKMYPDFGGGYLSKRELQDWQCNLCKSMGKDECEMFEYEMIIHEAEEMGISFERFTKEEFYTTVLMMYSDYCGSCGQDPAMYIKMAKDFLEDKDARYKFGEKLAAYYDTFAI